MNTMDNASCEECGLLNDESCSHHVGARRRHSVSTGHTLQRGRLRGGGCGAVERGMEFDLLWGIQLVQRHVGGGWNQCMYCISILGYMILEFFETNTVFFSVIHAYIVSYIVECMIFF